MVGSDGEVVRLVGTLTDVTEFKNAEERLLHDAVHDNLTGLPNRELFVDRLEVGAVDRQGRPDDPSDGDGRRPRPLQAGQRFGWYRSGRFHPADAGAPSRKALEAARHHRAARWRSVRVDRAVGERARPRPGFYRDAATGLARSDRVQRSRDLPHRFDRHCAPRRAAASHRRGAQGRRARDVSRQAHWRRPDRGVQALDARAQDRPPDAGIRITPRARARGDHHPLSADRAARGPFGRRLRGAGALGSPQDGAAVAFGIHLDRRGDRPDRRPRPVRARSHRAPARRLAAHARGIASRSSPASTYRRGNCCGRI